MSVGQQVRQATSNRTAMKPSRRPATPRPRWSRRWKPRRSVARPLREHYLHNHGSRLRIRAWPCADPQLARLLRDQVARTNFPKLVDAVFSAEMENGLDRIAHGEESGRDWLTTSTSVPARRRPQRRRGARRPATAGRAARRDERARHQHHRHRRQPTCASAVTTHLEDMEHRTPSPACASLPDTIAPDELTVAAA